MKQTILILFLTFSALLSQNKNICITMDDVPFGAFNQNGFTLNDLENYNNILLKSISKYNIPVTAFVNERDLIVEGETDKRISIYKKWITNPLITIGNHTFSHPDYATSSLNDFQNEIAKGEIITKMLLNKTDKKLKYFRFPFNSVCKDSISKFEIEHYLNTNGYYSTPFTIESADYLFNSLYVYYIQKGLIDSSKLVVDEYIKHTSILIDYFEKLTLEQYNRNINQIYLCHANRLNTDNFDKLIELFETKGYNFISLDETLHDSIYSTQDKYYFKWGVSWLYRWINDTKIRKSYMKAEPEIKSYYLKLYETIASGY